MRYDFHTIGIAFDATSRVRIFRRVSIRRGVTLCVAGIAVLLTSLVQAQTRSDAYSTEMPITFDLPASQQALDRSLVKLSTQPLLGGFRIQQRLPLLGLNDPFPMIVRDIDVNGSVRGRVGSDSKGPWMEGWISNLEIQIAKLTIDAVIVREYQGVRTRIKFQATCRNLRLDWRGKEIPFFVRPRILTGNSKLMLDLNQLTLSTYSLEPDVQLNCEGPIGVEQLMRAEILKAVLDRWSDVAFLEEVQRQLRDDLTEALKPGGAGIGGFRILNYKSTESGSRLVGLFQLWFDRPVLEAPTTAVPDRPFMKTEEIEIRLALPSLESVVQSYFSPGAWSVWTLGRDVQGFRDLMESRFSQIVAFPDLTRYPKNAPFAFSTSLESRMRLNCDPASREIEARTTVASWMVLDGSESAGSLGIKPLVYFTLPTVVRAGSGLRPKLIELQLNSRFHEKYVEEEAPDTRISHERIRDGIRPELEKLLQQSTQEFGFLQFTRGFSLDCDAQSGTVTLRPQ